MNDRENKKMIDINTLAIAKLTLLINKFHEKLQMTIVDHNKPRNRRERRGNPTMTLKRGKSTGSFG